MKPLKIIVSLGLLLLFSILGGCATSQGIPVQVKRPAEANLGNIQRIAVGRFSGRGGVDIGEDLTQALSSSSHLTVIDRNKVKQLIKEGRLAANGLVDQETAIELGKLLGVAAFVDGRVSVYRHQEKTDRHNFKVDGKTYRTYIREGTVTVEVAFSVVALETGQVLLSKKISKQNKGRTSKLNASAPRIDYAPIYIATRQAVIQDFMKSMAPYEETVNVKFLSDEKIPELERGIALVKIKEWHKAISVFKHAALKHPNNSKALYNLGVAYKYTYQFNNAEKHLKSAYLIDQNKLYKNELDHLRIMRKGSRNSSSVNPAPLSNAYISNEPTRNDIQPSSGNPLNPAWVQSKLNGLGYDCGEADGIMGPKTKTCIRAFQIASGLVMTGSLNDSTIEALLKRK